MKLFSAAVALTLLAGPVFAQGGPPTSNATIAGSATAPTNGGGAPGAAAPTGNLGTTTVVPGTPSATGQPAGTPATTPTTQSK